jgi:hypothetical protein
MFLEWAPASIFKEKEKCEENNKNSQTINEPVSMAPSKVAKTVTTKDLKDMLDEEDNVSPTSSVFVKNISFSTSQEAFTKLFETVPDFVSVIFIISFLYIVFCVTYRVE